MSVKKTSAMKLTSVQKLIRKRIKDHKRHHVNVEQFSDDHQTVNAVLDMEDIDADEQNMTVTDDLTHGYDDDNNEFTTDDQNAAEQDDTVDDQLVDIIEFEPTVGNFGDELFKQVYQNVLGHTNDLVYDFMTTDNLKDMDIFTASTYDMLVVAGGDVLNDYFTKAVRAFVTKNKFKVRSMSDYNFLKDSYSQDLCQIWQKNEHYANVCTNLADIIETVLEQYKDSKRFEKISNEYIALAQSGVFTSTIASFVLNKNSTPETLVVLKRSLFENPRYHYGLSEKLFSDSFTFQTDILWVMGDYFIRTKSSSSPVQSPHDNRLPLVNIVSMADDMRAKHRAGWPFVMDNVAASFHSPNASLQFDGYVDKTFLWCDELNEYLGITPYRKPCPTNYLAKVFSNVNFLESLPYCQGLIVLSEYLADQRCSLQKLALRGRDMDAYFPTESTKAKLAALETGSIFEQCIASVIKDALGTVRVIENLPNREYDDMLTKNIVFLDLVDVSACNVVIECMARHTPLLVNRHPAVVEYLGGSYPFYYSSIDEANKKSNDLELIEATHKYLANLNKDDIQIANFIAKLGDILKTIQKDQTN
ncbi:hypothetical protein GGF31_003441 [Allomyces arbusculus]|nr:hypothetical protein GGF31_003441 [Allomyces arbusculus]